MAATHIQPLLNHPSTSAKKTKTSAYFVLSFLAIFIPTALVLYFNPITFESNTSIPRYHHAPLTLPAHVCTHAYELSSCLSLLAPFVAASASEIELLKLFLNDSTSRIGGVIELAKYVGSHLDDTRGKSALTDCQILMQTSIDHVRDSISVLSSQTTTNSALDDARTWLSSVLTNHVTCLDGLNDRKQLNSHLKDVIARARTSLAILASARLTDDDMIRRPLDEEFPPWVTVRDRKLLTLNAPAMNVDLVVAKDGSGNYETVKEAVAAAPANSKTRFTIWIKNGTYDENIEVPKNKKNIMLTGDGMDATIITGSLNVVDGSTTFNSGTLIVSGAGFIAQDLWIQNTAGAEKHQAVALRVSADQSVINRCRLDAYQDTLYTHTQRQFYRDCTITGTVDFIFGNAAVVLQNCQLVPRLPMKGQGIMVTAQGRTDSNQNTGISIQNCDIIASSDLEPVKKSFKTYLGRPWKEYSRTVVMQSNIGDVIDPAGWSAWNGDFALKTLYYGEYMNSGAGAGTSSRVTWPGYRVITSAEEANQFTVASMIQGEAWLNSTGVAYTEGL